jgi:hypothetical protein
MSFSGLVLYGIAAPKVILRSPTLGEADQTLTFTQPNRPVYLTWDLELDGDRRKAWNGELRENPDGFRVGIKIVYDYMLVADTQAWGKVFNSYAAGYKILLIPHDDAALKLQFDVMPDPRFAPGFLADRFLGHTCELNFTSRNLLPAIDLRTALNVFRPVTGL